MGFSGNFDTILICLTALNFVIINIIVVPELMSYLYVWGGAGLERQFVLTAYFRLSLKIDVFSSKGRSAAPGLPNKVSS